LLRTNKWWVGALVAGFVLGLSILILAPSRFVPDQGSSNTIAISRLRSQGVAPRDVVELQLRAEQLQSEKEDRLRTFAASLLGGLAVGAGALVAYRSMEVGRGQLHLLVSGQEMNLRQLELSQAELVASRFKNAVEHLGSTSLTVRLGGVYALTEIAADHVHLKRSVFEILSAVARVRSAERIPGDRRPAADLLAVIAHLGSGPGSTVEAPIDLHGADLHGLDLSRLNFSGANLERTLLAGCILDGADFTNARMEGASLYGALSAGTVFDQALMPFADLQLLNYGEQGRGGPRFRSTNLYGANLFGASLDGSEFTGCDLYSSDLTLASVSSAVFERSNFTSARMIGVNGTGAVFSDCSLNGISALSARFRGAQFRETGLSQANFKDADLGEVIFDGCEVSNLMISGKTTWPTSDIPRPQSMDASAGAEPPIPDCIGTAQPNPPLPDHIISYVNDGLAKRFRQRTAQRRGMLATLQTWAPVKEGFVPTSAERQAAAAEMKNGSISIEKAPALVAWLRDVIAEEKMFFVGILRSPMGTTDASGNRDAGHQPEE
jgi:uncharacterized protein YjbI with pentapeptide repeats